jgi:hypothetical protein
VEKFPLPIGSPFWYCIFMARSRKKVMPKKKGPGRPATGRDPVLSLRMSKETRAKAQALADQDGITLSKAIVQAIEKAFESRRKN